MSTDLDTRIKQIAGDLAVSFVKNYKCSLDEAEEFFYNNILGSNEVRQLIMNAANAKQLSKNAVFKEFIKKHKKELYYKLRQYKNSEDSRETLMNALDSAKGDASDEKRKQLLEMVADFHVSSQERVGSNEHFYEKLAGILVNATTIVDVGCGVQPLFFPRGHFPALARYVALDKDRESVELMQAFKGIFPEQYAWLHPRVWNISDGWEQVTADTFDVALLLKLVPVVKRTGPALLEILAKTPAEKMVISGVKEAMVKKQDVERRERKAINNFIETCGRSVVNEFELENEFFIIVS